ncbi:MAG: RHS repeat-associated core domain-containing protein, partial [Clostridia bacterium]|nr:RHS repeat-associated core domain-containing protein [Clostridia bacterium]
YTYNQLELPETISEGENITTINYDQAARPEKEILPNEVNIDYSFDECGRLTKLEHKLKEKVLAKSDYTYDENGNRITFTDEKEIAIKYNYDFLNQLKEMDAPNTEIEKYEYDAVGNRETEAGSIDNVKDNEYTYDFENKLIRTENEKDTINYTYDGDGTLIKKTITGSVNETYEYLYDYTAGLPRLLVEKKSDGTTYNYLYAGGRLYARKSNDGTVYYHQDGLGSTIAITNSTGAVINEYTYDVFGEPHIIKETVENSILFTGEPYDQSGLVYLRARYYDPTTGRFISKDTYKGEIADPSSQNSYAYCGNNPVNAVDPSGNDKALEDYCNKNYDEQTTITLVVEQPNPDSRNVLNTSEKDVGHTFVRIQYYTTDENSNQVKNVVYKGFYPKDGMSMEQIAGRETVVGSINNDSEHGWTVAITYVITLEAALKAVEYVNNYKDDYNMVSNNCTNFGVDALSVTGVKNPTSQYEWQFTWTQKLYFRKNDLNYKGLLGYNPADAGQDIRKTNAYLINNNGIATLKSGGKKVR